MTSASTRDSEELFRGVMLYPSRGHEPDHELTVHSRLAERIAGLLRLPFEGIAADASTAAGHYLVPTGTLVGDDVSRALRLAGADGLFGGWVPCGFMATKAISHGLPSKESVAPEQWCRELGSRIHDATLAGFTAFSPEDARVAADELLRQGPLRLKPVRATAGRGQVLVNDHAAFEEGLRQMDEAEWCEHGLVLEEHLEDVVTCSVGIVEIGGQVASYYGTQRLTRDNQDQEVYGGSEIRMCSGDLDALLRQPLDPSARLAIEQARNYDAAAFACYPAMFASRRNYDIAQGKDAQGRQRSGVLEQSWRIGGASGAEIFALEALRAAHPGPVRASTWELYGDSVEVPANATVLYRGHDEEVGPISKWVIVED